MDIAHVMNALMARFRGNRAAQMALFRMTDQELRLLYFKEIKQGGYDPYGE